MSGTSSQSISSPFPPPACVSCPSPERRPAGKWLICRLGSGENPTSMITLLLHLLRLLPFLCGGHRQLALDNLALRQQLAVYKRTVPRPRLHRTDRLLIDLPRPRWFPDLVQIRLHFPVGSNRKRARPSRHPLEVVGATARCEIAGAATLSTITLRHAGRPDCTARSSAPPTSAALVTSSPYAPKAPTARS